MSLVVFLSILFNNCRVSFYVGTCAVCKKITTSEICISYTPSQSVYNILVL